MKYEHCEVSCERGERRGSRVYSVVLRRTRFESKSLVSAFMTPLTYRKSGDFQKQNVKVGLFDFSYVIVPDNKSPV